MNVNEEVIQCVLERIDEYVKGVVQDRFSEMDLDDQIVYEVDKGYIQVSYFCPVSDVGDAVHAISKEVFNEFGLDIKTYNERPLNVVKAIDMMNEYLPSNYYTEMYHQTVYVKRIWSTLQEVVDSGLADLVRMDESIN